MGFDPLVNAIRSALRAVDEKPGSISAYLDLIGAYQTCAEKEREPELLEQAGYVIRDAKTLAMDDGQRRELAALEKRVATTMEQIRSREKVS